MTMAATGGPLAGVRVIDLTIWVQGPIGGTLLADLGADVIKVEKADGGDFSRGLTALFGVDLRRPDAPNLLWALCNRNKRAITLDLHHEAARAVFHRLLHGADVFLTNLHPSSLTAFAADQDAVRAVNPRIVYALALGLGEHGPWAADPCQDTVGMAYGGFMETCAASTETPYYPPGAMSDVLSGTMLAFGVLAALRERDRTGEGQYVSTSQLQSLLWLQSLNVGVAANLGEPFPVQDRRTPANPLVNTYRCADGRWIALGVILAAPWADFCDATDLTHLRDDQRFATLRDRIRNAVALTALLDAHFATAPAAHWLGRMRARGLWVAPVNRIADLLEDEQVRANGYLMDLDDGWRAPQMPFRVGGHTPTTRPAPSYGADTETVLRAAGLTDEEIVQLKARGAVW